MRCLGHHGTVTVAWVHMPHGMDEVLGEVLSWEGSDAWAFSGRMRRSGGRGRDDVLEPL